MKWPEDFINRLIWGDALEVTGNIPDNSIDLMPTDPPYGYSFMGRDWDKALVSIRAWKECLRVLKPGGFAFIMCAPRQDVLSRQMINLEEAGFITGFSSIYWAYASGFPKAQNISKMIDKKECRKRLIEKLNRRPTKEEFEEAWNQFGITGIIKKGAGKNPKGLKFDNEKQSGGPLKSGYLERNPINPQAKLLNGSYGGFQPKPAVEVILVVMKPLSEKTYMEQALKSGKGITWLDKGRIPYKTNKDKCISLIKNQGNALKNRDKLYGGYNDLAPNWQRDGRFPANLLVSDDVLNDGKNSKGSHNQIFITEKTSKFGCSGSQIGFNDGYNDAGSFSRYFDLDKWWEEKIKQLPEAAQRTFPLLIVPKASKSEKNRGCEKLGERHAQALNFNLNDSFKDRRSNNVKHKNYHPTVKPIKLMSYLIILGSHPNDIILDPFVGSGTTCIAARMMGRKYIGVDDVKEYVEIAQCRLRVVEAVLI